MVFEVDKAANHGGQYAQNVVGINDFMTAWKPTFHCFANPSLCDSPGGANANSYTVIERTTSPDGTVEVIYDGMSASQVSALLEQLGTAVR